MQVDNFSNELTKTEKESINANLNGIISTQYGSTPYMRELGLKKTTPEDFSPFAKNEYAAELIEQIETWEDRIDVEKVSFDNNNEVRVVIVND